MMVQADDKEYCGVFISEMSAAQFVGILHNHKGASKTCITMQGQVNGMQNANLGQVGLLCKILTLPKDKLQIWMEH